MDIRNALGESKLNKFHLSLLSICLFAVLMEGYDLVIIGSVLSRIIKEWNLSTLVAGLISSSALAGMMIGSFSFGILADKIGRKKVLILCLTLFSFFTGMVGMMPTPELFAACWFIAGLGIGGTMPNAISLLSDYSPKKQRNTILAICTTGMQIGGIIAPVISIFALEPLGWRFCFYIGFIPLISIPFMIKFLPESIDILIEEGKYKTIEKIFRRACPGVDLTNIKMTIAKKDGKSSIMELFNNKMMINTLMFWIVFFVNLLMIYGLNTWLPMLMTNAGYALGSGLTFLIILNSAGLFGSIILGRIADRSNPRKVLIILYLIGAVSMLLLSVNAGVVYAYIIVALCGLCVFGCQNINIAYVAQYYPGKIRTTGLGIANTVGRVGGILGPTLGGVLVAAKLPMSLNCLAFAIPGIIASVAYSVVRDNPKDVTQEANVDKSKGLVLP